MTRLLVIGDSLTFHGPAEELRTGDPRLWPNLTAAALGWQADVVAGSGWTARNAWWALTRDPRVWGELLPRSGALVLAVGGMDQLPAVIPTYLREGISYVRPGWLRRRVRSAYLAAAPPAMRTLRGPMRQLPQAATDHYLGRFVQAVRQFYPALPIALLTPPPYDAPAYPTLRFHAGAVESARRFARDQEIGLIDVERAVAEALRSGRNNPDGMHWGWQTHREVADLAAQWVQGRVSPQPTTGTP